MKSRGSSRQSLGHRPALLDHPSANGRENAKRRPLAGQSGLVIHIDFGDRRAPREAECGGGGGGSAVVEAAMSRAPSNDTPLRRSGPMAADAAVVAARMLAA